MGKVTMLQISAELVYFKEIAGIKNPVAKDWNLQK